MRHVGARVDPTGKKWCPKKRRGRCMEHSVHAATRALVETIAPTPIHLVKRALGQQAHREAEDDDDLDVIEPDSDNDDDSAGGDNFDFDPKDILGKILAFVNQVRSSPQARKYFQKLCVEENIAPLQLLKWVRTRWASLYDLITRLLDVRPVCTKFTLLADSSQDVPELTGSKSYGMFKLATKEWELLELIRDCLKVRVRFC
jgi:hypothetical protein